jgi:hypothetical protein
MINFALSLISITTPMLASVLLFLQVNIIFSILDIQTSANKEGDDLILRKRASVYNDDTFWYVCNTSVCKLWILQTS